MCQNLVLRFCSCHRPSCGAPFRSCALGKPQLQVFRAGLGHSRPSHWPGSRSPVVILTTAEAHKSAANAAAAVPMPRGFRVGSPSMWGGRILAKFCICPPGLKAERNGDRMVIKGSNESTAASSCPLGLEGLGTAIVKPPSLHRSVLLGSAPTMPPRRGTPTSDQRMGQLGHTARAKTWQRKGPVGTPLVPLLEPPCLCSATAL